MYKRGERVTEELWRIIVGQNIQGFSMDHIVECEKQPIREMRLCVNLSWFPRLDRLNLSFYMWEPLKPFSKQFKMKKKNWNHIRSHSFSALLSIYIASLWSSLSKNSRLIQQMHRSTFNEGLKRISLELEMNQFWSTGSNFGNFSERVRQPLSISGSTSL